MDVETKDVQDAITLSPYKPGTNLRVCPAPAALVKTHYSLLAISNVFGWAIIVISSDVDSCSGPAFILTRLDDLQTSIDQAEEFSPAAFNIQGTTQTVSYPLPLFARIPQYSSLMRPSRHGIGLSFWPPPMARYTYSHHTP
ncbi:hypothetical protein PGTUg99_000892 [Puccinia graminis f. sp. tritici]|uniref:Uncharacterized protein n=1 Tax=Puccinia graminis f. sp. tritici TaxID=56615 RepID=A0A5B0S8Q0_PUCGR|nr:hypothetical protein PGTUg99_000892 [Puccinia graminis f. sp. tritici]